MNERQRDLFLWLWSRRRAPGRTAIALRGAAIGAAGGLVFALIMMQGGATTPGVHAWDFAGQIGSALKLLVLSVPAFAFIGWLGADRIWVAQENMYQSMLAAGARVPEQKPVMQPGDRGPALAVAIAVAVIAGFILYLFITLG